MSKSTKEDVYKILQSKLIKCEIEPGTMLNEKELMDLYDIGRTPLRDVFMKLKLDDLIETVPQSGTFAKKVDLDELREVIETRIPLEGLAARIVPYQITTKQLEEIRFTISYYEKQKDVATYLQLKVFTDKLHNIYYGATNNKKLTQILINLHNISAKAWYSLDFKKDDVDSSINEWKTMENLIINKQEKELEEFMKNHIISFADAIKLDFKH